MLPRLFYRFRLKYLLLAAAALCAADYMGAFTHLFELPFAADTFDWPAAGDVQLYAQQLRSGRQPDRPPLQPHNRTFLKPCAQKCRSADGTAFTPARLVFLVKSAVRNFGRRQAIRNSWGFERRLSDVTIRTVFLLGRPDAHADPEVSEPLAVQHMLDVEAEQFGDLVQADFADSYFNNTLKTMAGFRWAVAHCPRAKFYMFVDDDYYVSAKNVLRFVRNPVNYPEYLEEADETLRKLARRLSQSDQLPAEFNGTALREAERVLAANEAAQSQQSRDLVRQIRRLVDTQQQQQQAANVQLRRRHLTEVELPDSVRLFSGFVFESAPHRHRSSKWYVPLAEYPWHRWPPYVTAGAFVLSREALMQMYYVSMWTKMFRFDDIYLGIVALKAGIEPLHCEEFYFHKAQFHGAHNFRYLIASHGYGDPEEMQRVWSESRAAGNA